MQLTDQWQSERVIKSMQLRSLSTAINTSTNRVQSKTAPTLAETIEAHPAASRTLELLAAEMMCSRRERFLWMHVLSLASFR